jgi:hypothetical protein
MVELSLPIILANCVIIRSQEKYIRDIVQRRKRQDHLFHCPTVRQKFLPLFWFDYKCMQLKQVPSVNNLLLHMWARKVYYYHEYAFQLDMHEYFLNIVFSLRVHFSNDYFYSF